MKATRNVNDVLVTYSLGSCVGMTFYDPVNQVGGLIHCMLPLSKIDPVKAHKAPAMFTDTGAPMLIKSVFDLGAARHNLIVKVAGASQLLEERKLFKIGERNVNILRKVLWKNGILILAEDVGGYAARTMALDMSSGKTTIKVQGKELEL